MTELNNVKIYLKGEEGFQIPTVVYIPKGLTDTTSMPVLIWLPGKGEFSNNGSLSEMKAYINKNGQMPYYLERDGFKIGSSYFKPDYPVAMPLLPYGVTLEGSIQKEYRNFVFHFFKAGKVGISGHSFGGQATWKARIMFPELFDCYAPIAGNFNLSNFLAQNSKYSLKPSGALWTFHGADDATVSAKWSIWNAGYLEGNQEAIEQTFNIDMKNIRSLSTDLKMTYDVFSNTWKHLPETNYPERTGCTIFAGVNHGSASRALHSAQYWGFLNYQFTKDGIVLPPVENPFEKMSNEELLMLISTDRIHHESPDWGLMWDELEIRGNTVKEKYSL